MMDRPAGVNTGGEQLPTATSKESYALSPFEDIDHVTFKWPVRRLTVDVPDADGSGDQQSLVLQHLSGSDMLQDLPSPATLSASIPSAVVRATVHGALFTGSDSGGGNSEPHSPGSSFSSPFITMDQTQWNGQRQSPLKPAHTAAASPHRLCAQVPAASVLECSPLSKSGEERNSVAGSDGNASGQQASADSSGAVHPSVSIFRKAAAVHNLKGKGASAQTGFPSSTQPPPGHDTPQYPNLVLSTQADAPELTTSKIPLDSGHDMDDMETEAVAGAEGCEGAEDVRGGRYPAAGSDRVGGDSCVANPQQGTHLMQGLPSDKGNECRDLTGDLTYRDEVRERGAGQLLEEELQFGPTAEGVMQLDGSVDSDECHSQPISGLQSNENSPSTADGMQDSLSDDGPDSRAAVASFPLSDIGVPPGAVEPKATGNTVVLDVVEPTAPGNTVVLDAVEPEAAGNTVVLAAVASKATGNTVVLDAVQSKAAGNTVLPHADEPTATVNTAELGAVQPMDCTVTPVAAAPHVQCGSTVPGVQPEQGHNVQAVAESDVGHGSPVTSPHVLNAACGAEQQHEAVPAKTTCSDGLHCDAQNGATDIPSVGSDSQQVPIDGSTGSDPRGNPPCEGLNSSALQPAGKSVPGDLVPEGKGHCDQSGEVNEEANPVDESTQSTGLVPADVSTDTLPAAVSTDAVPAIGSTHSKEATATSNPLPATAAGSSPVLQSSGLPESAEGSGGQRLVSEAAGPMSSQNFSHVGQQQPLEGSMLCNTLSTACAVDGQSSSDGEEAEVHSSGSSSSSSYANTSPHNVVHVGTHPVGRSIDSNTNALLHNVVHVGTHPVGRSMDGNTNASPHNVVHVGTRPVGSSIDGNRQGNLRGSDMEEVLDMPLQGAQQEGGTQTGIRADGAAHGNANTSNADASNADASIADASNDAMLGGNFVALEVAPPSTPPRVTCTPLALRSSSVADEGLVLYSDKSEGPVSHIDVLSESTAQRQGSGRSSHFMTWLVHASQKVKTVLCFKANGAVTPSTSSGESVDTIPTPPQQAESAQPALSPQLSSQSGQSAQVSVHRTQSEQPVLPAQSEQPVLPAQSEQPVLLTQSEQPVVPTWSEQAALPAQSGQPVLPAQSEQPVLPAQSACADAAGKDATEGVVTRPVCDSEAKASNGCVSHRLDEINTGLDGKQGLFDMIAATARRGKQPQPFECGDQERPSHELSHGPLDIDHMGRRVPADAAEEVGAINSGAAAAVQNSAGTPAGSRVQGVLSGPVAEGVQSAADAAPDHYLSVIFASPGREGQTDTTPGHPQEPTGGVRDKGVYQHSGADAQQRASTRDSSRVDFGSSESVERSEAEPSSSSPSAQGGRQGGLVDTVSAVIRRNLVGLVTDDADFVLDLAEEQMHCYDLPLVRRKDEKGKDEKGESQGTGVTRRDEKGTDEKGESQGTGAAGRDERHRAVSMPYLEDWDAGGEGGVSEQEQQVSQGQHIMPTRRPGSL